MQIRDSRPSHVHNFNNRDCWKLFKRRLILRETQLLFRAVEALKKAQEVGMPIPFDLEILRPSLRRVEIEVQSDETLIRDAIDMVTQLSFMLTFDSQ